MGGKAFSQHDPPLKTPRLAPQLYYSLRDKYIKILASLFKHVGSPTEAPSKIDHGDIDILICDPYLDQLELLSDFKPGHKAVEPSQLHFFQIEAVKALLKPDGVIYNNGTLNLALPHPELEDCYVQIDVNIVPTYNQWRWILFTHCHGDFFGIIGTSLRRVGLVGNTKGFYARDVDIEPHDGKKCLVFLTDDPAEVIEFLGLDPKYWLPLEGQCSPPQPFANLTELFTMVANMRFFRARQYIKSDLKTSDRAKAGSRDAFRIFIEDFVPTLTDFTTEEEPDPEIRRELERQERARVFDEVLDHWGKREGWIRAKSAWENDRLDLLVRRKFNERKRFLHAEICRYVDAWVKWCGFEIAEGEAEDSGMKTKKKNKKKKKKTKKGGIDSGVVDSAEAVDSQ